NGGSGSFYILWSGLYKPTTAGAIPYYTGQYAPKNRNGSKRGFAFVTIGAGIEDFTKPARETEIAFTNTINANMTKSILQLGSAAMILFLMVIFVAILFSSYLTDNIKLLIKGISRFRSGEWQFRLRSDIKDEFGTLANSFDDMADSIENSVNEPISIIDMNYKVIYMNSCTLSVINKTLDEVIGVAYDNVSIYPNGSKYDPIAALHEDREAQIYYMSDNKRYYKGTANYIVDQNGKKNGYIIMTNDITIIEEARKNAEQASHAKSDFLARMSHEIRTPMNAIIGMASIALNKDMPAPIREHLQTIKGAGTNLLSIINDILDISKIESGKIEIIPKDYLFSSLINDVVSIVRTKIVDSKIRFDLNIDGDIPNALFGDEARIRQVLLNVLGNAAKYTKEGFIYLYVSGKRVKDTLHLVISVADSGVGIKQEDISKLFKSFARVDLKANIGIEGTGLGLAITKSLVNAMGGNISVESEYGKGSTFTITLPQKIRSLKSLNDADSAEKDNNFVIKFNAPKAKVLVVDDLNTNLKIAEGLMEPYRMQVDSCLSGQKAIDLIMKSDTEKRLYDVVFMDHMMPEMDGVEATKHIRGQGYDFPIIALTANAVSGAKEMFLENGFNDFLSKPIDMAELNAVLKKWLPKEKQEDANHTVQAFKLDFSLRMLAVLNKDLVSKMAEIEKCLESEDYHLYTVHVHGIKSATASIGAKEISELAKTLEAAGKEKNAEFIKLNTPKFMADLQGLIDSINMRFKGNPEKKALDSGAFVKLKKLKEALKDFDTDVIDEALDYLLDFERTEGILQNVLANNYDNAITMIENLRS
ncbi:MAG: ATP-binding protein, partial [Fibromonadales bacterium]|nr:ATP-binding protein [Fibromonadales bacterium]